ncbi:transcriptional regulator [Gordonia sp. ABSL49_1]|uniref:transcriptional regulator n=1 Tax=Gordonia sp. ABSL49_1 TaxID=2920941 RepID=UPI001F0DD04C|nr:transcriptional regulator [Gordonia sp. ABSL49_1]MCH5644368.1 transcriptional regulator [Gordonia sp. ABSL49_1]
MRHARTVEPGPVSLLAAILEGTADLSGAPCIGRPELFDARRPDEDADDTAFRHRAAVRLCHRCTAFTRCRDWASTADLDESVVAGRIPDPPIHGKPGHPPNKVSRF